MGVCVCPSVCVPCRKMLGDGCVGKAGLAGVGVLGCLVGV